MHTSTDSLQKAATPSWTDSGKHRDQGNCNVSTCWDVNEPALSCQQQTACIHESHDTAAPSVVASATAFAWAKHNTCRVQVSDHHTACLCIYLLVFDRWLLLNGRQLRAVVSFYSLERACSGKLRWMRTERSQCRCAFMVLLSQHIHVVSSDSRLANGGQVMHQVWLRKLPTTCILLWTEASLCRLKGCALWCQELRSLLPRLKGIAQPCRYVSAFQHSCGQTCLPCCHSTKTHSLQLLKASQTGVLFVMVHEHICSVYKPVSISFPYRLSTTKTGSVRTLMWTRRPS